MLHCPHGGPQLCLALGPQKVNPALPGVGTPTAPETGKSKRSPVTCYWLFKTGHFNHCLQRWLNRFDRPGPGVGCVANLRLGDRARRCRREERAGRRVPEVTLPMDPEPFEVGHAVREAINILSSSRNGVQISEALGTIKCYLGGTENQAPLKEREEFTRVHFSAFLRGLVSNLSPDWIELLTSDQQKELWDSFFLEGPADQAFLVLLDSIISMGWLGLFHLLHVSSAGEGMRAWETRRDSECVGATPNGSHQGGLHLAEDVLATGRVCARSLDGSSGLRLCSESTRGGCLVSITGESGCEKQESSVCGDPETTTPAIQLCDCSAAEPPWISGPRQPSTFLIDQKLLTSMMGGMKCRLDSNLPRVRRLGMIVAESISSRITTDGPSLKFQYEDDDETRELKSLQQTAPLQLHVTDLPNAGNNSPSATPKAVSKPSGNPHPATPAVPEEGSDLELDSDDDLVPYDMSEDKELKKMKAPVYIRDCIEVLTGSEDMDKWEATMKVLESLIRRNSATTREVSMELAKVLLHLEEKTYIEGFVELRKRALVAVTIIDPVPVVQYLTSQFYSLNYSLYQRMDILDVLALAAQELSQPQASGKNKPCSTQSPCIQTVSGSDSSQNWRRIVDERIKSKTHRLAKGQSLVEPACGPNKFSSLAGHFFFPLIQNFDRPLVTFDLLGDDHLVLGRLAHTLAILMYFAIHTVAAATMGKSLLEFVWTLRFHTDSYVRQGLLSAVSSVLLSIPSERLLEDMTDEFLETQSWLEDVAEKDPDGDCRRLAWQNLLLMENLLKKTQKCPYLVVGGNWKQR
ncbi:telomere length regulation protein TEL2 homolog isoform X11 [Chrysemys picta bellii]|uniref:telomere length regulation protein TEL2 homolog isoform X11 n=1 Tax=Chrysemys picta bellii TaxID=8478 RepID=UPI0032B1263A